MAKHKRSSDDVDAREEYDSDGGFVEDAPKSKKAKGSALSNKSSSRSDSKDDEQYWELASEKKRAAISEFKGKLYVDIRDYYEKDGALNRTQKGTMLSVDAFNALLKAIPEIKAGLKAKGAKIEDEESEKDQSEEEKPAPRVRKATKTKAQRSNIEATSDEEED